MAPLLETPHSFNMIQLLVTSEMSNRSVLQGPYVSSIADVHRSLQWISINCQQCGAWPALVEVFRRSWSAPSGSSSLHQATCSDIVRKLITGAHAVPVYTGKQWRFWEFFNTFMRNNVKDQNRWGSKPSHSGHSRVVPSIDILSPSPIMPLIPLHLRSDARYTEHRAWSSNLRWKINETPTKHDTTSSINMFQYVLIYSIYVYIYICIYSK